MDYKYTAVEVYQSQEEEKNSYYYYEQKMRFYKTYNEENLTFKTPISNFSIQTMDVIYDELSPFYKYQENNTQIGVFVSNNLALSYDINSNDTIYLKIESVVISYRVLAIMNDAYGLIDIDSFDDTGVILIVNQSGPVEKINEKITFLEKPIRQFGGKLYQIEDELRLQLVWVIFMTIFIITTQVIFQLITYPVINENKMEDYLSLRRLGFRSKTIKSIIALMILIEQLLVLGLSYLVIYFIWLNESMLSSVLLVIFSTLISEAVLYTVVKRRTFQ